MGLILGDAFGLSLGDLFKGDAFGRIGAISGDNDRGVEVTGDDMGELDGADGERAGVLLVITSLPFSGSSLPFFQRMPQALHSDLGPFGPERHNGVWVAEQFVHRCGSVIFGVGCGCA